MNLEEFQKDSIRKDLGIDESWGRVFSFIDFGNVNFWFEKDIKDGNNKSLGNNQRLSIGLEGLSSLTKIFCVRSRFYFGMDINNKKSIGFVDNSRKYFNNTITKPVQIIRHYLNEEEISRNYSLAINNDNRGSYINIPKCNFDVEICVDAIRLIDNYDTFCLFSSDADFVSLVNFIKGKGKKVILVKSGFVQRNLINLADIVISAQDIKKYITIIKQKSS